MFKRVERKRRRREEDEQLGLDHEAQEILGLNDRESDESESGLEYESVQSDDSGDIDNDSSQGADAASQHEGIDTLKAYPISVAEALKDPIYFISFSPSIHGCVLCKKKQMKNVEMVKVHSSSNAHKRRLQHFKLLSAGADPCSDAWELVEMMHSTCEIRKVDPSQKLSKRALKRQTKQAAVREKRKHHKELKAKAIAQKASKGLLNADTTRPRVPSGIRTGLRSLVVPQNQPGKSLKKQKLGNETSSPIVDARTMTAKSTSHSKPPGERQKRSAKDARHGKRKIHGLL